MADVELNIGITADSSEAVNEIKKGKEALEKLNDAKIKIDSETIDKATSKVKQLAVGTIQTVGAIDGLSESFKKVAGIGLSVVDIIGNLANTGFTPLALAFTAITTGATFLIQTLQKTKVSIEELNNTLNNIENYNKNIEALTELTNRYRELAQENIKLVTAQKVASELQEAAGKALYEAYKKDPFEVLRKYNEETADSIKELAKTIKEASKISKEELIAFYEGDVETAEKQFKKQEEKIIERLNNLRLKIGEAKIFEPLIKQGFKANEVLSIALGVGVEDAIEYSNVSVKVNQKLREVINSIYALTLAYEVDNDKVRKNVEMIEKNKKAREEMIKILEEERAKKTLALTNEALKEYERNWKVYFGEMAKAYSESLTSVYDIAGIERINALEPTFFDKFNEGLEKSLAKWGEFNLAISSGEAAFVGLQAGITQTTDLLYQYGEQIAGINDHHLTMANIALQVAKAMIKATLLEISQIAIKKGTFYLLEGGAKFFSSLFPPNPLGMKAGLGEMAKGAALVALGGGSAVLAGALTGSGGGGGGKETEETETTTKAPSPVINQTIEIYGTYDNRSLEQTERFLKNIDNFIRG